MDALTSLAFDHAPVGLIYTEARVIRRANVLFCEMFDAPTEALINQSLSICYPMQSDYDRIGEIGPKLMTKTGTYADERIMRRLTGERFWCQVRGQTLDRADPFARAIWSFVDLSDIRLPETLRQALTAREKQIVELLAEGLSSKEIGRTLEISHRTVEAHKLKLFRKLDAKNTIDLLAKITGMP